MEKIVHSCGYSYVNKTPEKPKILCHECKREFKTDRDLERHQWTYHPRNEYEELWSKHEKEGWVNWSGSSYFTDNPYY
jgi:hypothetical protein